MGTRNWLKNKWVIIKDKLHITSWQAILHFAIVEIVLNIIWDKVSLMFQLETVREVGFLVIFVSVIFAVAWYLPKLAPALYSFSAVTTSKSKAYVTPTRMVQDGVLWQDGGYDSYGYINVIGPLCQKDYTPLAIKNRDRIETNITFDTIISDSEWQSKLVCPECKTEYTLGKNPKKLGDSHNEVRSRFEGKRRRDYQP